MVDIENLTCPCSKKIMFDPVCFDDGFTFEREFIEEHLAKSSKHPITGNEITNKNLTPNLIVKKIIDQTLGKNLTYFKNNEVYLSKRVLNELYDSIINDDFDNVTNKLANLKDYRYFTRELSLRTKGYTAIHLAAEKSSMRITRALFEYLLSKGLLNELETEPPLNWSPKNLVDLIDAYLQTKPFNDEEKTKVKELLKFDQNIKKIDSFFLENLVEKYSFLNLDIVKWLFSVHTFSIERKDEHGNTLLLKAAIKDNRPLFEYLLSIGADFDVLNEQDENCFYISLKRKHSVIFKQTIDHLVAKYKTTQSEKDKSIFDLAKLIDNPLHIAMILYPTNLDLLQKIICLNKAYIEQTDSNKKTPLFYACDLDNVSLVKLLLENGANINKVDSMDRNCLHYVVKYPNTEILNVLIDNYIHIDQTDKEDTTPIDLADNNAKKILRKKKNEIIFETQKNLEQKLKTYEEDKKILEKKIKILEEKIDIYYSLNGKFLIASGNLDGTIKIWNVITGDCVKIIKGHSGIVRVLDILPDGNLISCSDDKTVKIWDRLIGVCLKTLESHTDSVYALKLLNYPELATGSKDNSIKIWNLKTCTCVKTFKEHTGAVLNFEHTINNQLISCSYDGKIKIWDLNSDVSLKTFVHGVQGVLTIKIKKDDQFLSGSMDKTIKLWDIGKNCCLREFDLTNVSDFNIQNQIYFACMIVLNEKEVACSFRKKILIYNLDNTFATSEIEHSSLASQPVHKIELIADGKLISCCADKTIKLWDLNSNNKCLKTITNDSGLYYSLKRDFLK